MKEEHGNGGSSTEPARPAEPRPRRRRFRAGAVIAVAAAAGLLAWAFVGNDDGMDSSPSVPPSTTSQTTASATPVGPIGMSVQGLRNLARTVSEPIYWAGPKPGHVYELTKTSTGKVFVRYLPPGVAVGSKQRAYLIIATYPFRGAFEALEKVTGGRKLSIPGGGRAVVDQNHPESVHLAYPGSDVQVEIYDPSPVSALQLARSGDVRPVATASAAAGSGAGEGQS